MRARILAMLVITSLLAACGTTGGRDHVRPTGAADTGSKTTASASHARHGPDYDRAVHYHDEPSPEEMYAAEIALLLTAQIFVCSFVVVVLDGHCELYASTGFYY